MTVKVGIVDDHQLFLKSLSLMLSGLSNFEVVVEALNGFDLQQKLSKAAAIPDIILVDVSMPVMDGRATAEWVTRHHPSIKLIALSMSDSDNTILEMIRAGCCAYLLKDTHPNDLEKALTEVAAKGFYNSDVSNINYRKLLLAEQGKNQISMTDREKEFLQLACSEMTYKTIASTMGLSERTIDGYRESLFQKFNVGSRVGLALEAIRRDLVKL